MNKPERKDANTSLKIGETLKEQAAAMAHRLGISLSEFVRQAIQQALEREATK